MSATTVPPKEGAAPNESVAIPHQASALLFGGSWRDDVVVLRDIPHKCPSQTMKDLKALCGLDEQTVSLLYSRFRSLAPSGFITYNVFKASMGLLALLDESFLCQRLFQAFDFEQDHLLDFLEWGTATGIMMNGTEQDKLAFSFRILSDTPRIESSPQPASPTTSPQKVEHRGALRGDNFDQRRSVPCLPRKRARLQGPLKEQLESRWHQLYFPQKIAKDAPPDRVTPACGRIRAAQIRDAKRTMSFSSFVFAVRGLERTRAQLVGEKNSATRSDIDTLEAIFRAATDPVASDASGVLRSMTLQEYKSAVLNLPEFTAALGVSPPGGALDILLGDANYGPTYSPTSDSGTNRRSEATRGNKLEGLTLNRLIQLRQTLSALRAGMLQANDGDDLTRQLLDMCSSRGSPSVYDWRRRSEQRLTGTHAAAFEGDGQSPETERVTHSESPLNPTFARHILSSLSTFSSSSNTSNVVSALLSPIPGSRKVQREHRHLSCYWESSLSDSPQGDFSLDGGDSSASCSPGDSSPDRLYPAYPFHRSIAGRNSESPPQRTHSHSSLPNSCPEPPQVYSPISPAATPLEPRRTATPRRMISPRSTAQFLVDESRPDSPPPKFSHVSRRERCFDQCDAGSPPEGLSRPNPQSTAQPSNSRGDQLIERMISYQAQTPRQLSYCCSPPCRRKPEPSPLAIKTPRPVKLRPRRPAAKPPAVLAPPSEPASLSVQVTPASDPSAQVMRPRSHLKKTEIFTQIVVVGQSPQSLPKKKRVEVSSPESTIRYADSPADTSRDDDTNKRANDVGLSLPLIERLLIWVNDLIGALANEAPPPTDRASATAPGAVVNALSRARSSFRSATVGSGEGRMYINAIKVRKEAASSRRRRRVEAKLLDSSGPRGLVVHFGHESWNMVLNIMVGIKLSASRSALEPIRTIEVYDYLIKEKFSILPRASGIIHKLSHYKYTAVRFIDYSPMVFRQLRELSSLSTASYIKSVGPEQLIGNMVLGNFSSLSELCSEGKSGALFYYTSDGRFLVKTMSKEGAKLFRSILKPYYDHLNKFPGSLISRFHGFHAIRLKRPTKYIGQQNASKKLYLIVMGNVFHTPFYLDKKYDLKGSWIGRTAVRADESLDTLDASIARKDNDFFSENQRLKLTDDLRQKFIRQVQADVTFLREQNILDYSLLLGIHFRKQAPVTDLLPDLSAKDQGLSDHGLSSAASNNELSETSRVSRMYSRIDDPNVPPWLTPFGMPASDGSAQYVCGIIDIFTRWSSRKRLEHAIKSVGCQDQKSGISCVHPKLYADRFLSMVKKITS